MPAARHLKMQATRLPLQLRAVDQGDFPLISPVVRMFDQTGTDRIVANVLPLLRVTFITAEEVIEKAGLPKSAADSKCS